MNNEHSSKESLTDWERLATMDDEDIDLADIPEITPGMFAESVMRRGLSLRKNRQSAIPDGFDEESIKL